MAKTYSPGATDRDRIRLRLADNVDVAIELGGMILDDAEIDDLLASYTFLEAAAQGAESIAAYLFRQAEEEKEDDESDSWRGRAKGYLDLAASIRASGQTPSGAGPRRGYVTQMTAPDLTNYRS